MGKYFVDFETIARKDLQVHYKSGNKAIIKKIEKLLIELSETPFEGIGKPEALNMSILGIGQED